MRCLLWCSLVEPTPCVNKGGRRRNSFRRHAKVASTSSLQCRAKRDLECQGDLVAVFVLGRDLLPRRPPGYTWDPLTNTVIRDVEDCGRHSSAEVLYHALPLCMNAQRALCYVRRRAKRPAGGRLWESASTQIASHLSGSHCHNHDCERSLETSLFYSQGHGLCVFGVY